jgi:CHAT domain-containing protein
MIDLGFAQPIDSLILAYRQEIKNVTNLGVRQREDAEQRVTSITQKLYCLLFAPIKAALLDSGTIYCASDGLLHLLPFEILVDDNGKYLMESYQFNYLGSGRDLLRFSEVSKTGAMYVFAHPNFDGKPAIEAAKKESLLAAGELVLPSENVQRSRDWRGGKFTPLDGTVAEAHAIQSLFNLNERQMFFDLKASEENLLSLKSPWRLHIATHGFFLNDIASIASFDQSLTSFISTDFNQPRLQQAVAKWENPLLRSGLALAGANTIGQKQDSTQTYDGIATAYEISGMNLQGTDLVVLSACETGLGEVQNGEGVFGLRRTFQLAGAQTVVMSLWKVPDNETKELMIDFYTRLKNGEGKSQALRNAQLAMMRKQKEKYGLAHPYFWGAFICAGNPE